MGHDVTHICLMLDDRMPLYRYPILLIKGVIKKYVFHKNHSIFDDITRLASYQMRISLIKPFYEEYINHTEKCITVKDITKVTCGRYDAFIVGSDQIWRKEMTHSIGWENFMLAFLKKENVKRVAYGISFGKNKVSYSSVEQKRFLELYRKFDFVSVREDDGLSLLREMGCDNPNAVQVLDPTLLLEKDEYLDLFANQPDDLEIKGKMFCYVLDDDANVNKLILQKSAELKLHAVRIGLSGNEKINIPLWLKCIHDSDFIVTDSFHAVVFSILFEKKFFFCGNSQRGNSRVESLFRLLEIDGDVLDYSIIREKKSAIQKYSLEYLRRATSL